MTIKEQMEEIHKLVEKLQELLKNGEQPDENDPEYIELTKDIEAEQKAENIEEGD